MARFKGIKMLARIDRFFGTAILLPYTIFFDSSFTCIIIILKKHSAIFSLNAEMAKHNRAVHNCKHALFPRPNWIIPACVQAGYNREMFTSKQR